MKCNICGKEIVSIDYPANVKYHTEDTEWGIWPEGDDPGWLVAKPNTKPIGAGCDKII